MEFFRSTTNTRRGFDKEISALKVCEIVTTVPLARKLVMYVVQCPANEEDDRDVDTMQNHAASKIETF